MKKVVSYLTVLVVSLFTFVSLVNAEEAKTVGATDVATQVNTGIEIPDGKVVVYIGREGCGYCQAFVPGLKYLSEKYNFKYKYVNTDEITDEELDEWLKKLNVNIEEFGTPTFASLENQELKESHVGFLPEDELFEFLQKNGTIEESAKYESQFKNIDFINDQEYLDLVKSNKKALVVLSQITNAAGLNSRETLNKLSKKYGIKVYFYNLGFATQEDFDKFVTSNKYIEENINTLSLPTFMVIKGSETLDVSNVATTDGIEKFVKNNFGVNTTLIIIIALSVLLAASLTFNVIYLLKLRKNNEENKNTTKKSKK